MAILILAGNLSFRHQRRYEWNIIFILIFGCLLWDWASRVSISRVHNIKQGYPLIMTYQVFSIFGLSWIFSTCDVDLKMRDLGISYWHIDIYIGQFLQIILLPILQINSRALWILMNLCMNKKPHLVNNQRFDGVDALELQNLRTTFKFQLIDR